MKTLLVTFALLLSADSFADDLSPRGWTTVANRLPLETDAEKICGALDAPPSRSPAELYNNEPSFQCRVAVRDLAQERRISAVVAARANATERDVRVHRKLLQQAEQASDVCIKRATETKARNEQSRARSAATRPLEEIADIDPSKRLPVEAQRMADENARCRAEIVGRRTARIASASSLTPEDIERIDVRYRLPEEESRLRSEAERRKELIARLRADPRFRDVEFARRICEAKRQRTDAIAEMRTEKRYARVGGVESLTKVYSLQNDVRDADEEIRAVRAEARSVHAKVPGCEIMAVRDAISCAGLVTPPPPAQCLAGDNPARAWVAAKDESIPDWAIAKLATLK